MTYKTIFALMTMAALLLAGCLSPSKMIPESCKGASDIPCLQKADVDAQAGTLQIFLRNNVGEQIKLVSLQSDDSEDSDCFSGQPQATVEIGGESYTLGSDEPLVEDGQKMSFTIACNNDIGDDMLSQDLRVTYNNPKQETKSALVKIKARP